MKTDLSCKEKALSDWPGQGLGEVEWCQCCSSPNGTELGTGAQAQWETWVGDTQYSFIVWEGATSKYGPHYKIMNRGAGCLSGLSV